MKLADAEIFFEEIDPGNHEMCYYRMSALANVESVTEEDGQKIRKMRSLLGLNEYGDRRFDDISEAVEAIEQALKLAPRARIESRR